MHAGLLQQRRRRRRRRHPVLPRRTVWAGLLRLRRVAGRVARQGRSGWPSAGVVMAELRFDNRVAVVTGAGRGLGRDYALLLASRGAKVVVNDTGAALTGAGTDGGPAHEVVAEIGAAGGEAVACVESVTTPAGGQAIIQAALDTYGRIDILIHN